MAKTLVIVESPTKAKTIAKFLGNMYIVESSFGHVRDLPKSSMGIAIGDHSFEPEYTVSPEKKETIQKLKKAKEQCSTVIFATDEDREGEAISWHLAKILNIAPSKSDRIVFHEITKHAIEEALKHPRHIDQKLVDAQQARRVLDRLVGYELSPLLWKKVARGLSAGRVQSVAVRLIVERERERQQFITQEYWTIEGQFHNTNPIKGILREIDGKKIDKFDIATKQAADDIIKTLDTASYTVHDVIKKEGKKTPPPPFRTSTLQQQANNAFGYSAKQTMRIAQQLYEGIDLGSEGTHGLITYMRTDSTNLATKFLQETHAYVTKAFGNTYALTSPRVYKSTSKGAQEAHEAIRPTDPTRHPESIKQYLDPSQYKLYSLIWKRTVATQMAEARIEKTTIDIEAKKHIFRSNGERILFDGWLALYQEQTKEHTMPALTIGESIHCHGLTAEGHTTEPPARYSDATLVKVMEEYGIGRPSTYAPTIGTIEARKYVTRDEHKRLMPTDVAFVVTDLLLNHFTEIVDYHFTAEMENNLDEIAEGKKDWQPVIALFYHPFHETIVQKSEELQKSEIINAKELGMDPKTGKPISVRIGRFGPFVQKGTKDDEEKPQFASIPSTMSMETITLEQALTLLELPRTIGTSPEGEDLVVNIGRFGPYIKMGKKYYSIKAPYDPYTITHEEGLLVIAAKQQEEAEKIIHNFADVHIQVLRGRYGPYITDGEKNAKIPKDTDPKDLTKEACITLLKDAKPGKKRYIKKSVTKEKAKKTTTKKRRIKKT